MRLSIIFALVVVVTVLQVAFVHAADKYVINTIAGTGAGNDYGSSGDGSAATSALLLQPRGVAVDALGYVYIADIGNHKIRKVSTIGIITTIAGTGVSGSSGDGSDATSALLNKPSGVSVDALDNVYIADNSNNKIRKISSSGIITTIAGNGANSYSGDGGPATDASLSRPYGVAVDSTGKVVIISDFFNYVIRKVDSDGIITTIAGTGIQGSTGDGGAATSALLYFPTGVAVDAMGNVYIADGTNRTIRMVGTDGIIITIAGTGTAGNSGDGSAAAYAQLGSPYGVALDAMDNVYIADRNNNNIRRVATDGIITTIAGDGANGYSGDGGAATSASIYNPYGLAVDGMGNVYIADTENHKIRKLTTATEAPTVVPTLVPTLVPTAPTEVPTEVPTEAPTEVPTEAPTEVPTLVPTLVSTLVPTLVPTEVPTETPTVVPTKKVTSPSSSKVSFNAVVTTTRRLVDNILASDVEVVSANRRLADSILSSTEEVVVIATHAAILGILNTYISIVSAVAVPGGCTIVIKVEMPYDVTLYASPIAMYTALTTSFINACDNGAYATELEAQAAAADTATLQGVTIINGYVTRPDDLTADAASPTDRKLYGLIALSVIPIAGGIYTMYAVGVGAGGAKDGVATVELADVTTV